MEVLNYRLKQSREGRHNALRSLFNEDDDSLSSSNTFWDIDDYNDVYDSDDECSLFDVQPRNPHEKTLKSTEPYQHFIYYFLLHAIDSDFKFLLMLYYDRFSFSPEKFKFSAYSKGWFWYFSGFRTRRSFVEGVKIIQEEILSDRNYLNSFCRNGPAVQTECLLCYMPRMLNLRSCCDYAFCNECIARHICFQLENGSNVICPGCPTLMRSGEVLLRLEYSLHRKMFKIYTERLKASVLSSTHYMCWKCSRDLDDLTKGAKNGMVKLLENTCSNCGFVSCPAGKCRRQISTDGMDLPTSSSSNETDKNCKQEVRKLSIANCALRASQFVNPLIYRLNFIDYDFKDSEISSLYSDSWSIMEVLNCCLKQSRDRRHNAWRSLFNEDDDILSSLRFWDIDNYNDEESESDEGSLCNVHLRSPHEKTLKSTVPYQHFIYYVLLHTIDSDLKFLLMLYYDRFSFSPEKFKFGAYSEESSLSFVGCSRRSFVENVKTIKKNIPLLDSKNTYVLDRFYGIGWAAQTECLLCCMPRMLNVRSCCDYAFCNECIAKYVCVQLENGSNVICPGCPILMRSCEVLLRLEYSLHRNMFKIYTERLKELPLISTQYKCPNCLDFLDASTKTAKNKRGKQLENTCSNCGFVSCPACKSPRHQGLSCKQYQKGDKSMKRWADSEQAHKTRNATKCPKCKRWYQKTYGCDHMNCMACGTEFCYSCGGKYRNVYLLGSHTSRFSVLGCPNNFLPNHSVLRKTIRGSLVVGFLGVMATKYVAHKISMRF